MKKTTLVNFYPDTQYAGGGFVKFSHRPEVEYSIKIFKAMFGEDVELLIKEKQIKVDYDIHTRGKKKLFDT